MAALLNMRHEKFAQGIVDGLTPIAAYQAAFPNSVNWQQASVSLRANDLMKEPSIQDRIDELQGVVNGSSVLSFNDRMIVLTHIALNEELPVKQRMGAIDLLNKMDGTYVKKVEATIVNDLAGTAAQIAELLDDDD